MKPICVIVVLFSTFVFAALPLSAAAQWPPISKEELAMTDDPSNPGAAAIILYREVNTDDVKGLSAEYRRIKVLTDEGKKYADIEIPYVELAFKIEDIQARTIRPDGTAVDFSGQIFDRNVVKTGKARVQVKTLTLPEVQKGSILEYSYTLRYREKTPDVLKNPQEYIFKYATTVPSATWTLQEDLFTRHARFSVQPFPRASLEWNLRAWPGALTPLRQSDGSRLLEIENIPAFQAEEFMPPENWVRSRLSLYYLLGQASENSYWEDTGAIRAKTLAPFLGDPKKFKREVAGLVSVGDTPEMQLRKLYLRAQRIRYLSFEPSKTEQEVKRENLKGNKNVEDILRHDYAYANEINLVLVAMARAAGFEAAPVLVKSRNSGFFDVKLLDSTQLNAMVVWVRAESKDYFLDPATRYCPFGLLPWDETATSGILVSEGPSPFGSSSGPQNGLTTPAPTSSTAWVERTATLQLNSDGAVEGVVAVDFVGQEALQLRIAAGNLDEGGRKKALEDVLKGWISNTATVQLEGAVNWDQLDQPLRANFAVKVPEFAVSTGRRLLFRPRFFESAKAFQSATRIHDIYFPYPFQEIDEITWKLPDGFRARSLPDKNDQRTAFGNYSLTVENVNGGLHAKRIMTSESVYVTKNYYAALRAYFGVARLADENQVVLESAEAQDGK